MDPIVLPKRFRPESDGRMAVDVRQVTRGLDGRIIKDSIVQHVLRIQGRHDQVDGNTRAEFAGGSK